jgi:hypothetical protein
MPELNPLAGAILQSIQSQRQTGIEKERQVRRAQILEKDAAAQTDRFEHQVESSDELAQVNEEEKRREEARRGWKRKRTKDEESGGERDPHIDLTA